MRIEILKSHGKHIKGQIRNLSVFMAKNLIHLGIAKKSYK